MSDDEYPLTSHFSVRVGAGLLLAVMSGCQSGSAPVPGDTAAGPAATSLHAVMSEQLALDSARLDALLFDLHRTETVLAAERRRQVGRIGETARSLQAGAARVRELGPPLPLATSDSNRFDELAGQLESLAESLAALAESGQLAAEQMESRAERINATCSACHNLYRDPGRRGR